MHDYTPSDIPLPTGWPLCVRSAVIHVISLAHYAITCARGWAANSINARVRLTDQNERLGQDAELLREEIRIKGCSHGQDPSASSAILPAYRSHACALRCLGQRWLKILWKMWQTGTTYDEALHMRNQIQHGSWAIQLT